MPQVINTNIASLNAQRNLNASQGQANVALERLSSGLRINSAKDDAAGLAISAVSVSNLRPEPGSAERQRRYLSGTNS